MTALVVSPERAAGARELAGAFKPGTHVVLTTHVNADGDGVGSEVGLWHLLQARGVSAAIANPTPVPERFHFLLPAGADRSDRAVKELEQADLIAVLDIGDLNRVGDLGHRVAARGVPVACIDHHVSPGSLPPGPRLIDPTATATAELVHDLAVSLGWPIGQECARALYVGILTDTGGFRFSNTTPRALRVAAALLEAGVHPESIYEQVYASAPEGRVRLLAEVLQTLVVEADPGMAWVTVPPGALERHRAEADDLDGIVEFARSVAGTRLALLFRQLANGRVKVSFRSRGPVDVADLAQRFGGGGHVKAAGASLDGAMGDVQETVLAAARAYLRNGAAEDGTP
jgi:phosphoesterase RecJ-like protein